ncbi:hypothetical protein B7R54_04290 [Subtercola boreus]|uniref:MaoC-like domain-containing protein n=1 Tax=Subtercola boreus TaxID=120213 RepID=A0A3E0VFU2_9MICO|nr:MaoC family dehydratase [Subtercola boreus]RFA08529.1 hypothetical protein B7R54_04290 [Subtercola boreus]TQL54542.1 acyl dehydratase [Subtercola boreus]
MATNRVTAAEVRPGASWSRLLVQHLTRGQIVQYAGASGDFNPLHTDEPYAVGVAGYPSVFAHGMLTMALAGSALTDLFGADSLARFGGRFRAQVWPDDTLTAGLRVEECSEDGSSAVIALRVVNQLEIVVFEGSADVRVGRRSAV